jgi:hypothetical protein
VAKKQKPTITSSLRARKVSFVSPSTEYNLDQSMQETDNDISTDLDDSMLSFTDTSTSDYLTNLSLSTTTSTTYQQPVLKKQKTEVLMYPFFLPQVQLTKLAALRIMEFLDDEELFTVSKVSHLLYSAAMDDALWESS